MQLMMNEDIRQYSVSGLPQNPRYSAEPGLPQNQVIPQSRGIPQNRVILQNYKIQNYSLISYHYAGINFIQNHPPGQPPRHDMKGAKTLPPGQSLCTKALP